MKQNRKKYDKESKQEVIILSYTKDNTKEIVDESSIDKGLLYRWERELKKICEHISSGDETPGISNLKRENIRLRKKIKAAMIKQVILKKAISKFLLSEEIPSGS